MSGLTKGMGLWRRGDRRRAVSGHSSCRRGRHQKNRLVLQGSDASPNAHGRGTARRLRCGIHFVDNDGPVFWIRRPICERRAAVIAIDTRHPERANWKTIVPESADTLEGVAVWSTICFCSAI